MAAQDNLNEQQFTTLYHGTSSEAADKIKEEGFTSAVYGNTNLTLTSHRGTAGMYGALRSGGFDNSRVVHFHIPTTQMDEYTTEPVQSESGEMRGVKKTLPASWVHEVSKY